MRHCLFLSPHRGSVVASLSPTACAVGCGLPPLSGCVGAADRLPYVSASPLSSRRPPVCRLSARGSPKSVTDVTGATRKSQKGIDLSTKGRSGLLRILTEKILYASGAPSPEGAKRNESQFGRLCLILAEDRHGNAKFRIDIYPAPHRYLSFFSLSPLRFSAFICYKQSTESRCVAAGRICLNLSRPSGIKFFRECRVLKSSRPRDLIRKQW
jgi:hypothetical protein